MTKPTDNGFTLSPLSQSKQSILPIPVIVLSITEIFLLPFYRPNDLKRWHLNLIDIWVLNLLLNLIIVVIFLWWRPLSWRQTSMGPLFLCRVWLLLLMLLEFLKGDVELVTLLWVESWWVESWWVNCVGGEVGWGSFLWRSGVWEVESFVPLRLLGGWSAHL